MRGKPYPAEMLLRGRAGSALVSRKDGAREASLWEEGDDSGRRSKLSTIFFRTAREKFAPYEREDFELTQRADVIKDTSCALDVVPSLARVGRPDWR